MKKIIPILALLLCLVSCATTSVPYSVNMDETPFILSVEAVTGSEPIVGAGVKYLHVMLENTTQEAVTIDWNKSSMTYKGTAFPVFQKGQPYDDAGRYMPPTLVPSGESAEVYLTSTRQLMGAWSMIVAPRGTVLVLWVDDKPYRVAVDVVV